MSVCDCARTGRTANPAMAMDAIRAPQRRFTVIGLIFLRGCPIDCQGERYEPFLSGGATGHASHTCGRSSDARDYRRCGIRAPLCGVCARPRAASPLIVAYLRTFATNAGP